MLRTSEIRQPQLYKTTWSRFLDTMIGDTITQPYSLFVLDISFSVLKLAPGESHVLNVSAHVLEIKDTQYTASYIQ